MFTCRLSATHSIAIRSTLKSSSNPLRTTRLLNRQYHSSTLDQNTFHSTLFKRRSSFSNAPRRSFTSFRNSKSGTSSWTQASSDTLCRYTISIAYDSKTEDPAERKIDPRSQLKEEELEGGEDGLMIKQLKQKQKDKRTSSFERPASGEDNYVLAINDELGGAVLVGVADGVGGWHDHGYDSSLMSSELTSKLTEEFMKLRKLPDTSEEAEKVLYSILNNSFDSIKQENKVQAGSTTVCFGYIDPRTNKLYALNLGDSWFCVFRPDDMNKYRLFTQSVEQTVFFNAPYQLSIIPKFLTDKMEEKRKEITKKNEQKKREGKFEEVQQLPSYIANTPSDADFYQVDLKKGDLVVFTTDGVTDNVTDEDIANYFTDKIYWTQESLHLQPTQGNFIMDSPDTLGSWNTEMVGKVKVLSMNPYFPSVFSQKISQLEGGYNLGGKPDDITCALVYVD